jgi:septal ring factor EnvC (AmiA/AmiB activator)
VTIPVSTHRLAVRSCLLVAVSFMVTVPRLGAQPVPPLQRQQAAAQRTLDDLRTKVAALQRELAAGEAAEADAVASLRESEGAISDATRTLAGLSDRRSAIDGELALLRSERSKLSRTQRARQAELRAMVLEQFRRGTADPLLLWLSGSDPATVRREHRYLATLNAARLAALTQARRNAERLGALEKALTVRMQEIEPLAAAAEATRQSLEAGRADRAEALAKLGTQLESRRHELAVLERDEKRLGRLLARLDSIVAASRPSPPNDSTPTQNPDAGGTSSIGSALRGTLRLPAQGELRVRFGAPREGSGPAWKGWFIRAPAGTEVKAVAAGRVVYSDWLRGFGNLLIVDHGGGFMSLYANNDALLQQVGNTVEAGRVIAQAGSSGGAAESGVYFEWRHDGIALDPKEWFARDAMASSLKSGY